MSGRGKKPAAPKKKANGYKMPAPIANGEVIHDAIMKKKWRIGPSIGVGGFGEIYSACDADGSPKKATNYPFVVKIEPHENGPLFVEKHFYVRNANKDDIAKYMKTNKLTSLGMPTYFGNGSHDYKGEKYRYLVLERYGKDIWTLFKDAGRSFPPATVFQMGLQMLDVLEYIHSRGYVHADIKGANILLGLKKGTENQAYLVDFGLATRVNDKEFKPDPKCAHNGTIEYTSRDAHLGVSTMRGDLEILGYNMLQWIVGELPWEKSLKQPKTVQDMKEAFLKNVRSNITKLSSQVPDALIKFFEYINTMKPKGVPDYTKCRQLFETYLKSQGKTRTSKLDFTPTKKGKPKHTVVDESDEEAEKPKKKSPKQNGDTPKTKRGRKPAREPSPESDNENEEPENSSQDSIGKKVVKRKPRGRKPAREPSAESDNENEEPNSSQESKEKKVGQWKPRGRKPAREPSAESDNENEEPNSSQDSKEKKVVQWKPRGRKPIREPSAESDNENEEPDSSNQDSVEEKVVKRRNNKRKSSEPAVLVKVKKTKLAPKATPPTKKNHANMATQTSVERPKRSPRQVSFDSPICEIIGEKKPFKASKDNESANSSGDIFEDSFVIEEKKVKPKKRLISDEEIIVKRVVKKKTTTLKPKAKSWKDTAAILNGRSPPK